MPAIIQGRFDFFFATGGGNGADVRGCSTAGPVCAGAAGATGTAAAGATYSAGGGGGGAAAAGGGGGGGGGGGAAAGGCGGAAGGCCAGNSAVSGAPVVVGCPVGPVFRGNATVAG